MTDRGVRQRGRKNTGRRCALESLERRYMLATTLAGVELEAIGPTQVPQEETAPRRAASVSSGVLRPHAESPDTDGENAGGLTAAARGEAAGRSRFDAVDSTRRSSRTAPQERRSARWRPAATSRPIPRYAMAAAAQAPQTLLGDLTGNGTVDFADLTVLLAHWNQQVSAAEGNLVQETTTPVNFQDLTVLLAAWTGATALGVVDGLTASVISASEVRLDWNDTTGEDGYRVYRETGGVTALAGTVAAGVTQLVVFGLQTGTLHRFRVEAFDGSSTTTSSWIDVATLPAGPIEPGSFAPLALSPVSGSHSAAGDAPIILTLTQPIDAAALSDDALVVYGSLTGRRLITPGSLVVDGQTVTFTPQVGFLPGETVQVGVTTALVSQQGMAPTAGSVWQFRIATTGGSGVMQSGEQPLGSLSSFDMALGDVNGDGRLDALVANFGYANELWLLGEDGSLVDSGQRLGDGASADVELGDLDGDGDLDAFVANVGVNKVWLNDGQGILTESAQTFASIVSLAVELADLDGDGDLDAFVVQNSSEHPAVWLNIGDGTFTPTAQPLDNSRGTDVALADFDRDGDLDALVTRSGAENLLWLNNGAGGFTASTTQLGDTNTFSVAVGDVNGDGHLDLLLANGNDRPNEVWLGDGTGGLIDSGQKLGAATSFGVELGDLDGDGDLDAIVANFRQANRVWINDGAGVFSPAAEGLATADSRAVSLGDLDGDGDLDALVANSNLQANTLWFNAAAVDEVFDGVG